MSSQIDIDIVWCDTGDVELAVNMSLLAGQNTILQNCERDGTLGNVPPSRAGQLKPTADCSQRTPWAAGVPLCSGLGASPAKSPPGV